MSTPEAWMEEARRRHDVALFLYEAGTYPETLARSFYVFVAVVEGLMAAEDIVCTSHPGRMRQLSRYYIKPGTLDRKHVRHYNKWLTLRNRVDYDMMPVEQQKAVEAIGDARTFLEEAETLL